MRVTVLTARLMWWEGRQWKVARYEIWGAEHGDIISGNNPPSAIGSDK
ncbi:MAG: hypothetical protein ACI9LM_004469 [Alteromonadaceae bacterium]|jgi:hypothetical protein